MSKSLPMTGYTKLFGSIVASTIWRESKETKIVWITMLAVANKSGIVEASLPGLADLARVTVEECEKAIKDLESPDPYSRTKEHEGRRIQPVDGGWAILNHAKYRAKMGADERRDYLRQKQAEYRKSKKNVNTASTDVNKCQSEYTPSTHAEAEAKADTEAITRTVSGNGKFQKPTIEAVKLQAAKCGLPDNEAERFFFYYESNGWRVGKNPMHSWTSALANWKKNWENRIYENGGIRHVQPTQTLQQKLSKEMLRDAELLVKRIENGQNL